MYRFETIITIIRPGILYLRISQSCSENQNTAHRTRRSYESVKSVCFVYVRKAVEFVGILRYNQRVSRFYFSGICQRF